MRFVFLAIFVLSTNVFAAPGDLVRYQMIRNHAIQPVQHARQNMCPAEVNHPKAFETKSYAVTFVTLDLQGNEVNSSGYLVVPVNNDPHGLVVYQHGTMFSRKELPSSNPEYREGDGARYCFASLGFVAMLPDYLGYGDGTGVHPYLHAESESWVARDMMRAVHKVLEDLKVEMNGKIFIAGYSQGGQAALALTKFLEEDPAQEFKVTASAPMSGPYSLVEVVPHMIKNPVPHTAAEAVSVVLGLGRVYPIYAHLSEVFQAPYDSMIESLFDGQHTSQEVFKALSAPMNQIFQPAFTERIINDPNAPLMEALRRNRVDLWANKTPVNLYHGKADAEVPYLIAEIAYKNMKARGGNVNLVNLGDT
ncbi:MAG: alpha/beta hydrolase family protein, partial [Pseudobdellovibrionaceae bacterium]